MASVISRPAAGAAGRGRRLTFQAVLVDTGWMRAQAVNLPRLLAVLVVAFAQFESRPILGAVELFRGFVLQLAFRWGTGCIAVDQNNRAVLLWSVASPGSESLGTQLLGMMAATAAGIVMVAFTGAVAMALVGSILLLAGLDLRLVLGLVLAFVTLRWTMTCVRAVRAYRTETSLYAKLPDRNRLRWSVDFLAAIPARTGHGGRLLERFLELADRSGAQVVLHCDDQLVGFYRRHGSRRFGCHPPAISG